MADRLRKALVRAVPVDVGVEGLDERVGAYGVRVEGLEAEREQRAHAREADVAHALLEDARAEVHDRAVERGALALVDRVRPGERQRDLLVLEGDVLAAVAARVVVRPRERPDDPAHAVGELHLDPLVAAVRPAFDDDAARAVDQVAVRVEVDGEHDLRAVLVHHHRLHGARRLHLLQRAIVGEFVPAARGGVRGPRVDVALPVAAADPRLRLPHARLAGKQRELLIVVRLDVRLVAVHARREDAERLGLLQRLVHARLEDLDVLERRISRPHARQDLREERVGRAVHVAEHERVVDPALELGVLEQEPVLALRVYGRQLEEVRAQYELDPAEQPRVLAAYPLRDLVVLVEQVRVEHRALVDDEHVGGADPAARVAPELTEQVADRLLAQAHARPPLDRRAADERRGHAGRRRDVHRAALVFAQTGGDHVD